ncbi:MAG: tRNA lysidine(34) synthetase TilS [Clostridia bacterium]|nr:tRNA lysidine(34) synthetase TilS [Clostridia bacterium]
MLTDTVSATIKKHALLDGVSKVICALSGGADSVCLLYVMKRLAAKYAIEVAAAHLNHMIRGAEALEDEKFVHELCKREGVQLFCRTLDIPAIALARGEGLEECGRNERYAFFESLCAEGEVVATAHNLCDAAETVLFRLTRGTSAAGLRAIAYKRGKIIRPLLDAARSEIEEYLADNTIEYCTDSTNASEKYARNRIRLSVMPVLESVSHNAARKIVRAASLISEDDAFLTDTAKKYEQNILCNEGIADCGALLFLPRPIARRIANDALKRWGVKNISADKVDELLNLCSSRSARRMDIDGKRFARKEQNKICVQGETMTYNGREILAEGASVTGFFWTLEAKCVDKRPEKGDNNIAVFDFELILAPLIVRAAHDADFMRLANMSGRKRVKDIYSDAKVPLSKRHALPVVLCGDDIIYAPPLRQSRLYAPGEATKKFLIIEYREAGK